MMSKFSYNILSKMQATSCPKRWQDLPMGDWLFQQCQRQLIPHFQQLFGNYMIKLGYLSTALTTSASPIPHQLTLGIEHGAFDVETDLLSLPLQTASIDACIMACTLNYSQDPHQLLREVERVLTDSGIVIIVGCSSISYLALSHYYACLYHSAQASANIWQRLSCLRIKDWLQLLNFDILANEAVVRLPLGNKVKSLPSLSYIAKIFTVAYIIVACKRCTPLTPIRPIWHAKPKLMVAGSLAKAKSVN